MIYFLIYIYILVCALYHDVYGHKRYFRFNYSFLYILFVLVAGLRYRLGTDTVGYMYSFDHEVLPLSQMDFEYVFSNRNQPFWVLLNSFCKSFGNFYLLQILISLILNTAIFVFLRKTFAKPFTALLIYYLLNYIYFSMEILRESLAISCFLFAILQLNKGSLLKYYLWVIAAFMFHFFSAFLFFVPLFLSDALSFKVKMIGVFSLLAVFFVLQESILMYFIAAAPPTISKKIFFYATSDSFGATYLNIIGLSLKFSIPFALILLSISRRSDIIGLKDSICKGIAMLYIVLLAIVILIPIFERFSNYFYIIISILFASLFYRWNINKRSCAVAISFIYFVVLVYQVYQFTRIDPQVGVHSYARYFPYTSIFNEGETKEREIYNNYWQDY